MNSIPRRDFLAAGAAAASLLPAQSAIKPNILYLHSHDTGRYLEPYGASVPAPHFQKLAQGGVLFRRAFSAAPTCSPSRASLLTGQCAHSNGMLGLAHRGFSLNDYKQHMLHTLRPAGYYSALIGVQHIARQPEIIGYDEIVKTQNTHVENVAPAAVAFLNRKPKQPFFLDVGFQETHREFRKPGPGEDVRYSEPPRPIPDTPETREDMAAFRATARVLDQGVGAVLDALEKNGLAANTLVISTTDHGIAFPSMKCNCTDHGIGISLIMRGPGGFSGGKVSNAMVSHIDLFPTICDLVGLEHPSWLQGKSMMPLMTGQAQEIREELFAEVNYHAAYEPQRAIRTQRWKYIQRYGTRTKPVLPNCDDGPSKTVWLENGWKNRVIAPEQLYDLVFDPNETRNLFGEEGLEKVTEDLRVQMRRWMRLTNDPLLQGPVKAPTGAVVNDPDGTSPQEKTRPAA